MSRSRTPPEELLLADWPDELLDELLVDEVLLEELLLEELVDEELVLEALVLEELALDELLLEELLVDELALDELLDDEDWPLLSCGGTFTPPPQPATAAEANKITIARKTTCMPKLPTRAPIPAKCHNHAMSGIGSVWVRKRNSSATTSFHLQKGRHNGRATRLARHKQA